VSAPPRIRRPVDVKDERHLLAFLSRICPEPNTGCWLWTGYLHPSGYGLYPTARGALPGLAHRISYEIHRGAIPNGLQLDHLCRTKACVNPAHLEPVTLKENVLRGIGISAINARKTRCQNGHLLQAENLDPYFLSRGERVCRECRNARRRERRRCGRLASEAAT
jgi:hypothetical protein